MIAGSQAISTTLYVSRDRGNTWATRNDMKPDDTPYRSMLWAPDISLFLFAQSGLYDSSNLVFSWDGSDASSFVGGQPKGLNFKFGNKPEIYAVNWNPKYKTMFASYNTESNAFWSGQYSRSSAELVIQNSVNEPLLLIHNNIGYPLGGASVERSLRFDASKDQDIWPNDGVLSFRWNSSFRAADVPADRRRLLRHRPCKLQHLVFKWKYTDHICGARFRR
jgi:hypothetical protein